MADFYFTNNVDESIPLLLVLWLFDVTNDRKSVVWQRKTPPKNPQLPQEKEVGPIFTLRAPGQEVNITCLRLPIWNEIRFFLSNRTFILTYWCEPGTANECAINCTQHRL